MQIMMSGNTAININGEVGPYFRPSCGVRQGDPLSPLLFNSAVDALAEILEKAKNSGHITGVLGHLIPRVGVTHLQYADDTMIMVEGSELDIITLKFLLLCFEAMSGLKSTLIRAKLLSWASPLRINNGSRTVLTADWRCSLLTTSVYLSGTLTSLLGT